MKRRHEVITRNTHEIPAVFQILDTTLYMMSHLFSPSPIPYDRLTKYGVYQPSKQNQQGLNGLRALLMTCHYMYECVGKVYYKNIRKELREKQCCLNCEHHYAQCKFCEACYCFGCEKDTWRSPYKCKNCSDVACFECARWNGSYQTCQTCMDNEYCYNCKEKALNGSEGECDEYYISSSLSTSYESTTTYDSSSSDEI